MLRPLFTSLALSLTALAATALAKPPGEWTCPEGYYEDDVCDCGCGADDPDCTTPTFEGCQRSGCAEGKVPWEHAPASCMTSACGDGWKDERRGEVCDDGNALASGGCDATCANVNPGWTCGERAEKCVEAAAEPGPETAEPVPEASPEAQPEATETSPEAESSEPIATGGCGGALPPLTLGSLVGALALWTRGRRTT